MENALGNDVRPRLLLGTSDFAQARRGGHVYIDKTHLAVELIRGASSAVLFPRPRRFGKTLNLSMLRYWFEAPHHADKNDIPALFEGLSVASAGADVAAHFQRHPVIYLTFKDAKFRQWEECQAHVAGQLRHEVLRHAPAWQSADLSPDDRQALEQIGRGAGTLGNLQDSLRVLSRSLHAASGQEVVLLVDEYDTPIHTAWSNAYYDEAIEFFRNLFSEGLKDNPHLYRGVLTGILRVAKESIFSGLNNVTVHSLLSHNYSSCFGFSDAEVQQLVALVPEADVEGIRDWYNGYRMGGRVVYNPWSVISYLNAVADGFRPYWVNTASDELLRDLLIRQGPRLHDELADLIGGGAIVRVISENIQLRDLGRKRDEIWSFLLFSGYLKAEEFRNEASGVVAELSIPNREVGMAYAQVFRGWLDRSLANVGPDELCRALLNGEEQAFEAHLQRLIVESLSYFDVAGRTPEAVYQAFLVGLLVHLKDTHVVESNRESGFGRYDICVRPRAGMSGLRAGAVLELKSIMVDRGETAEAALDAAMLQIRERQYATALHQAGADPVWLWAAVFDGKRAWVRVAK